MDTLLAFGAAIVSLRLGADLARRHRARGGADLLLWAGSLSAFAVASAALAWGSAAGWDERAFRVYYLCGGLLTAPLLGAGSLARARWRAASGVALLFTGLAIGIAVSEPVRQGFEGAAIPDAQDHFDLFPARVLAIAGNTVGTVAVVAVALLTFRRRPLGNALVVAGVATAALGSALSGLGVAESAASFAAATVLLYLGFVGPRPRCPPIPREPGSGLACCTPVQHARPDPARQPRESSQSPPTV